MSTRVRRPGNSGLCLLLSQQFELLRPPVLSTALPVGNLAGEARLLFLRRVKFKLYELGAGCMLAISVQCEQQGADSMFADGRTHTCFDRTPFDITQIGVAIMRSVKAVTVVIEDVPGGCRDCGP